MKLRMIRKSGGVALVTAIFLLVVLAGLGVAVVSLTTSQQASSTQDEQGARAYQAAKAGIEWALYVQLELGRQNGSTNMLGCASTRTFRLPAGTLAAYTVTVSCGQPAAGYRASAATDATAGGVTIRSVACNQPDQVSGNCPNLTPGVEYVARTIDAQL